MRSTKRHGRGGRWLKIRIGLLIAAVISSHGFSVFAAAQSDIQKRNMYAEQARIAREQAAAKAEEARTIERQINIVDQEIGQIAASLESTKKQIDEAQDQINDLSRRIIEKEDELAVEKVKLEKILASWYMQGERGLLLTVVNSSSLSEAVTTGRYYQSAEEQINMAVERIAVLKADLDRQKADKDRNLVSLQELKNIQATRESELQAKRVERQRVLSDTKNAIAELNAAAAAADKARAEIQARISVLGGNRSWGGDLVSSEDYWWYYSQLDYPNVTLGKSRASVADYGCLATSIAMAATYHGQKVTPPDIAANDGIFSSGGALMVSSPPGIGVTIQPSLPANSSVIDAELAAGRPVIVSLYVPSVGAINGDGSSHFVVIRGKSGGKYLMHDPLGPGRSYAASQLRSMKLVSP